MVKLNFLSSYEAEDCYRALRRLAKGKKHAATAQNNYDDDDDDDSEVFWATNELNSKRRFYRHVETLNAAKQNVGEALAMAELSLMATSAFAEKNNSSKTRRSSSSGKKRLRHYGHFKFTTRNTRIEKESKEDAGYFSRHSRGSGRTLEREACRDRVNRARSFQVRPSTSSHEDAAAARSSPKGSDAQGKSLRRSSSERARPPPPNSLHRSSSAGTSQSPVERHRDRRQAKDRGSAAAAAGSTTTQDGRTKHPVGEEAIVTDPDTGIRYKKGKLLGKGGFAKCFEFSDVKTKEKFAVKVVNKNRMSNPRVREKIIREIEIHRHLEHPNVVIFYGFFESRGVAYLILENCVQRSMVHVLAKRKTLTEPEVRYYMLQLISGCRYVHGRKIIHRDLKLGNMLLDDQMKIKIADFGLATKVFFEGEKKTSLCGTPNYIAPEVLQKKGHSYEADIWALGCVMYTMLCGQPPFETKSLKETYHRIINSKFTVPGHVTQPAAQLISKMLSIEPASRPILARMSADKFFVCGYTPSTLSTFCCHTAPRFALTSTLERNRSSSDNAIKKSKKESQNNIQLTKNTQRKDVQHRPSNENNKKTTTTATTTTTTGDKPKVLEMAPSVSTAASDSNARSLEKTFRIIDARSSVRSSYQHNNSLLDRLTESEECSISSTNTTQAASNDVRVGELVGTSFEPLFQLMTQTVNQHDKEGGDDNLPPPSHSTPPPTSSSSAPSSPLSSSSSSPSSVGVSSSGHSPLWITKWVDYSNKYGFGYQLSDGRIGILFSDSGHIFLSQDGKSVNYSSRLNKSKTFSIENVPSKLQKKLLVVRNLAEYMTEHLIKGGDLGSSEPVIGSAGEPAQSSTTSAVLLQKWYRDSDIILMQLNNGTLQANCLKDHSKIILSRSSLETGDYLLTYVRRGRPPVAWPLIDNDSCSNSGDRSKLDSDVVEKVRAALKLIDQAEKSNGDENERRRISIDRTSSRRKSSTGVDTEVVKVDAIQSRKDSHT